MWRRQLETSAKAQLALDTQAAERAAPAAAE
jgi:hypothetical protein